MTFDPELSELLGPASDGGVDAVMAPATVAAVAGDRVGGVSHDASKIFGELGMWRPPLRSANADLLPEKNILDAKSRDLIRNDAFVAGATTIWKDSIVGAKFMLNSRPMTKILWGKEDEIWEEEFQEEVEAKFDLWAESQHGWPDAARHNNFTAIIRLMVGVDIAGGEILGLAQWMPDRGQPFRTAFQMIDCDRLSDPALQQSNPDLTRRLRKGVEVDRFGGAVAYWIRNTHPSEGPFHDYTNLESQRWVRVPAARPWGRQNVLHVYEQMRPEQSRGVSMLASALNEMKMTKNFRKAQLQRAIIAASYAASFESELPNDVSLALGAGYASDGNATTQYMLDYLASVQEYSGGAKNLHMDGAQIPVLPPGTKLNLQNPGAASPDHAEYEMSLLRYTASALNMPVEQFMHDYRENNYSGIRASLGESWKTMQTRKRMVAERGANFIYRLWFEEAMNAGQFESLKRRNVPAFYEGLNAEAYCACDWIGAGRGTIDPLKETQADILAVKNGLETKEFVIARRTGKDYRRVAKQIQRERKLDEKLENPSIYDREDTAMENALSGTKREPKEGQADGE